eukprot:CAMPEP_0119048516 /NCGR_PEP_ID=MMETSP1177-20130426/59340_1 /TAXON_ID=2985 /ORGANISM="Ochromonas sp, Strain CCMP1899" /LENGTH=376 /DNA_ID=CAMNT_0007024511 /DNA_START=67 /DNA_END=1197 /DNA_ORIENTATION=+
MTRSSIEGHDSFFSRIIGMISTDLYKHLETDQDEDNNSKYYKHKKTPLAADEKKIASSKKRKAKYSVEGEEAEEGDEDEEGEGEETHMEVTDSELTTDHDGADADEGEGSSSADLDDLRQRLQRRILGLKSQRSSVKEGREDSKVQKTINDRKKAKNDHVKRKPSKPEPEQDDESYDQDDASSSSAMDRDIEDTGDVQFSLVHVKKSDTEKEKDSSFAKPGTKMKRLKRMLETADKKRQRLEELRSAGSSGAVRLKSEQWTDVIKSAGGEKTINDTTKLRKAIKKREVQKQKSAREWKGRTDTVENESKARIAKREENISVKKLGKAPKEEEGKVAKGEEKVGAGSGRPRLGFPGFEGKKSGFLNKGKGGGGNKKK